MSKSNRTKKPWAALSPGQRIGLYQQKSPRVPSDYNPSYDYFLRRSAAREAYRGGVKPRPTCWDEYSPAYRLKKWNAQDPRVPDDYDPEPDRLAIADYKRSKSPDDVKWDDMRPTRRLRLYMDGSPLVPANYEPEEDEARLLPTRTTKPRITGFDKPVEDARVVIQQKRHALLLEEVEHLSPLEVIEIIQALSESDETSASRTWLLTNLRELTFLASSALSLRSQAFATSE